MPNSIRKVSSRRIESQFAGKRSDLVAIVIPALLLEICPSSSIPNLIVAAVVCCIFQLIFNFQSLASHSPLRGVERAQRGKCDSLCLLRICHRSGSNPVKPPHFSSELKFLHKCR